MCFRLLSALSTAYSEWTYEMANTVSRPSNTTPRYTSSRYRIHTVSEMKKIKKIAGIQLKSAVWPVLSTASTFY